MSRGWPGLSARGGHAGHGGGGRRWAAALALALAGAGCGTESYAPAPIDPAQVMARLEGRSVADRGLRAFMARHGYAAETWPLARWDLPALVLAAIYFHPDMAVARADWAVQRAGQTTAARRANPGIVPLVEYHSEDGAEDTPWSVGIAFDLPLIAGEKRAARLARARALTGAARLEVAAAAWAVRARVRRRLLALFAAERRIDGLAEELAAREEEVALLERRAALGEASAAETATARLHRQRAQLALAAARGRVAPARAALAEAVGLPEAVVAGLALAPDPLATPAPDALPEDAVQTAALLNRLDVRAALARYGAEEAALRLEIARQVPDVTVSPGFLWDQGDLVWSLSSALLVPVLDRNQGPIAEARARRARAAARFTALQARVLAELSRARAGHRAAAEALLSAEALEALQRGRLGRVQRRFRAGEVGRLELVEARLERIAASQAVLDARVALAQALGVLEDAVQRPLGGPEPLPRDIDSLLEPVAAAR